MGPSLVAGPDTIGMLVVRLWGSDLRSCCGSAGGRGQLLAWLAAWPSHVWLLWVCWWVGKAPSILEWKEHFKMILASAGISTVEWDKKKKSLLPGSQSPEGVSVASHLSRRVSTINPGAFQVTSPALGLGVYELFHMSLKRRVSVSYTTPALLKISPAGFQSQMFWGFIFLGTKPWVRECKARLRLLLLRECCFSYPPHCVSFLISLVLGSLSC